MSELSWGLSLLAIAGALVWLAWLHWTGRFLTDQHPDGFLSRAYVTFTWHATGVAVVGLALLAGPRSEGWLEIVFMAMIPLGGLFLITGVSLAPWLLRRHRPDWQRAQVAWVREQEASDDPVPWSDRPDEVRFGSRTREQERARRASRVRLSDLREALVDDRDVPLAGSPPDPSVADPAPPEDGPDRQERP